jgi:hypothetical protein
MRSCCHCSFVPALRGLSRLLISSQVARRDLRSTGVLHRYGDVAGFRKVPRAPCHAQAQAPWDAHRGQHVHRRLHDWPGRIQPQVPEPRVCKAGRALLCGGEQRRCAPPADPAAVVAPGWRQAGAVLQDASGPGGSNPPLPTAGCSPTPLAGDSSLSDPAVYDAVVSVGSVDPRLAWSSFSNYNTKVELVS